ARPLVQMDDWLESHEHVVAWMRVVTPTFFDAMGIRLQSGRAFTDEDRAGTAPVAIVNESFARKYVGDRDPLKVQMSFGFPSVNAATKRAIVGVVNDVKYGSLWNSAEPAFYLVEDQAGNGMFRLNVVVATNVSDPRVIIPTIRNEVHNMDPQL